MTDHMDLERLPLEHDDGDMYSDPFRDIQEAMARMAGLYGTAAHKMMERMRAAFAVEVEPTVKEVQKIKEACEKPLKPVLKTGPLPRGGQFARLGQGMRR